MATNVLPGLNLSWEMVRIGTVDGMCEARAFLPVWFGDCSLYLRAFRISASQMRQPILLVFYSALMVSPTVVWPIQPQPPINTDVRAVLLMTPTNEIATEVLVVLATFFSDAGNCELKMLSANSVLNLLLALQSNMHYSIFDMIYQEAFKTLAGRRFDEFRRLARKSHPITRLNYALYWGGASLSVAFVFSVVLALTNIPRNCRAFLAPFYFMGFLVLIYAWNKPCFLAHGFNHRNLRSWEVFLNPEDYLAQRKDAGFFSGIARKKGLEKCPWAPEYVVRYLYLGDKFSAIRKYFGQKLDEEVWIEKPGIYQLNCDLTYSALFISAVTTAFFTLFFVYLVPQLEHNHLY
jgi:hypothetical protein